MIPNYCKRPLLILTCGLLGAWGLHRLAQAQPGMPVGISLLNVVRFYDDLPHQERAIVLLQQQINQMEPELLQADAIVTNVWRDGETLDGHVDILGQIAAADRSGDDPINLALAQVRRGPETPTEIELLTAPNVEIPDMAMVTVSLSGLLDDSVAGHRYRFDLRRDVGADGTGTWEIVRAGRQQRCQLGRGSQTWTDDNCI